MHRPHRGRPPGANPRPWRRIAATLRTSAALVWAGAASHVAAQTPHYALPEPGAYQCLVPTTLPAMRYNVLTRTAYLSSNLSFGPSALGTLVLEPGGRYRLAPSGERGTYAARADGAITFGGQLGGTQFTADYSARNGTFEIRITYRRAAHAAGLTSYCSRRSAAAQMTVEGPPNPGLPGRLVFAREGRVYEVAVEPGRIAPLADGAMPYAARNGELAYANAAGQIAVATPDGRTVARFDAEVTNNGLSPGLNWDAPVRREYVALAPDGSAIAYAAWDAVKHYRVVVRARSGRELVSFPGYTAPNFTPDGRLVLVGYPREGGPSGVYVAGPSFRGLQRLDPGLDTPDCPAVSPDGRRVAFVQGGKLWVMNADGSGARTLPTARANATDVGVYGWPAWSPDGRWIALTANLDGASYNGAEILVVSADGDATKLQWVADQQLQYVHTSGDRLTWR